MNKKLYVDLDGVFADFEWQAKAVLGMLCGVVDDRYLWAAVNAQERWFATLPMCDGALALWKICEQYSPTILTATGNNYEDVTEQKTEWIRKHLSTSVPIITVRKGVDKALHATPDSVLIDDQFKVLEPWEDAGGIGIYHYPRNIDDTVEQLIEIMEGE